MWDKATSAYITLFIYMFLFYKMTDCNNKSELIKVKEFFLQLNSKLKSTGSCFVSGTYIFEGRNVFDFLKSFCNKSRTGQPYIAPKSHNLHIDNSLFQTHKLNNFDTRIKNEQIVQYEVNLTDDYAIGYPCDDTECSKNALKIGENIENMPKTTEDEDKNFTNVFPEFEEFNSKDYIEQQALIDKFYCTLNYEKKKCVLFYTFTVVVNNSNAHVYTFVKLEMSPTTNVRDAINHGVHAFAHYFTKDGGKRKNTWPVRREDMLVLKVREEFGAPTEPTYVGTYKPSEIQRCSPNECKYLIDDNKAFESRKTFTFKTIKGKYMFGLFRKSSEAKYYIPFSGAALLIKDSKDLKSINKLLVEPVYTFETEDKELYITDTVALEFYNKYVRTRNEMFVPEWFYRDLLPPTTRHAGGRKASVGSYRKTEKRFPYNRREYVVYRDRSTRREYVRVKGAYVPCNTLKRDARTGGDRKKIDTNRSRAAYKEKSP